MNGDPVTDPFERFVAKARRRAWALAAIFGGGMGGIVIIGTFVSPPGSADLRSYFVSVGVVLAVAIGLPSVMVYNEKRTVRHLRPLKPHIAAASRRLTQITLLLRDGAVVTMAVPFSSVITCAMGFAKDGSVLHPSLEQGVRWTRPWHSERLGVVSKQSGPPDARAELDGLRKAIRGYTSVCFVGRLHPSARDPTTPEWIVSATFVSMFPLLLRVDALAAHLEAIERLLWRALGAFAFPPGVARKRLKRASS